MSLKSEPGGECEDYCQTEEISPASPLDDEAVEARVGILAQDVFSNQLIRKEIVKNLEIPDLLRASLVCKGWSLWFRAALREDFRVLAAVEGTCHDLKKFSSFLETSACSPFNGLSIDVHPTDLHECFNTDGKEASEIATAIAIAMDVKYLSIRVDGFFIRYGSNHLCVGIIREILKESAESLEELRFFGAYFGAPQHCCLEMLGINDDSFLLPNVRRLEFPTQLHSLKYFRGGRSSLNNSGVSRLITVSPKLEEIRGALVGKNVEVLLSRGFPQLVREFHFERTEVPVDTLHRFALSSPRLHALSFSFPTLGPEKEQAMKLMKLMLESSKKSLKTLAVSDVDLGFMLHRWGHFPVLENVENLRLDFVPISNFWRPTLSKFDSFKYFPKLEQVCVDNGSFGYNCSLLWLYHTLMGLPGEYTCDSATKIIFTQEMFVLYDVERPIKFSLFKQIFPNAKICWIQQGYGGTKSMSLSQLWSAWLGLEEICIFGLTPFCPSYDAEFMGISEEEYKFLDEHIVEFQSLELVPAKRCILDFRKLKKVVLQLDNVYQWVSQGLEIFMSPKVCSWMLSRMPGLMLEVDTFCRLFGQDTVD